MRTGVIKSTKLRFGEVEEETGARQWPLEQDAMPRPCAPPPGHFAIRHAPGPQQQGATEFACETEALQRVNEYGSELASRQMLRIIVSSRSFKV
jgi:hypothetical protein